MVTNGTTATASGRRGLHIGCQGRDRVQKLLRRPASSAQPMPETASSRPCSRVNGSRSRRSLLLGPISAELVMASSLPAAADRVLLDPDRASVERRRNRAEDRPGGGSVGTIIVRQWEKSGAQDPLEPAILLGAAALGARCTAARQTPSHHEQVARIAAGRASRTWPATLCAARSKPAASAPGHAADQGGAGRRKPVLLG